jgi:hypothetical protein
MILPAYLSAGVPRWAPVTEADLQAAIDGGLLEETHFLDLKETLEPGRGANKSLAKDVASFAVDGGLLIIGIAEDQETGIFSRAPQELAGLAERIDQVARSIPDPPIAVQSREIPSDEVPGSGYLLIHVPESPLAPHMVDGRYCGRSDKTNMVFDDAGVWRLHERRNARIADGERLVQAEFDRDPVANEEPSHLFLVAQPLSGRSDLGLRLTSGENWQSRLLDFMISASARMPWQLAQLLGFTPDITAATNATRRSSGAALATHNLDSARNKFETGDVAEVEIREDGGVRMFMSRLSDSRNGSSAGALFDAAAVLWARRLIDFVAAVAEQTAYLGGWVLGVGATDLRGKPPYGLTDSMWGRGSSSALDSETYVESTIASYVELTNQPGGLTSRLVGRLMRGLGTDGLYTAALTDPSFSEG